jgi:hypothetical protein
MNVGLRLIGQHAPDNPSDLESKEGRYCVPDLDVLLGSVALEEIVVWKRLEPRGFTYSQTATLERIWVNKIVAVL